MLKLGTSLNIVCVLENRFAGLKLGTENHIFWSEIATEFQHVCRSLPPEFSKSNGLTIIPPRLESRDPNIQYDCTDKTCMDPFSFVDMEFTNVTN